MNTFFIIALLFQLYKLYGSPLKRNEQPYIQPINHLSGTIAEHSAPLYSVYQKYKNNLLNVSKQHHPLISMLIISLISGDIQPNPGPTIYPCGFCELPVSWTTPGVECEACDVWFHKSCLEMCTRDYQNLPNMSWICCCCDSINCSNTTFHSYELSTSNYFDPLRGHAEQPSVSTIGSPDSVFHPKSHSSPVRNSFVGSRPRSSASSVNSASRLTSDSKADDEIIPKTNNWRTLVLNVNGLRDKAPSLQTAVEYIKPDMILACESKLSDKVNTSEVFPEGYRSNVYRRDRNDHGGGVFIAIKDGITASDIKMNSNCESVWAKVSLPEGKSVSVCSFYRPPGSGSEPITELSSAIDDLKGSSDIIVAGDFNCPNLAWDNMSITPNTHEQSAHQALIDLCVDHSLTQVQTEPTRGENCLDLYSTSNPSLVKKCSVVLGLSDHEMFIMDSDIKPIYTKKPPRKTYRHDQADWDPIRTETEEFVIKFLESCPNRSVEENWQEFKDHIQTVMDKHIPCKLSTKNFKLPWFNKKTATDDTQKATLI